MMALNMPRATLIMAARRSGKRNAGLLGDEGVADRFAGVDGLVVLQESISAA